MSRCTAEALLCDAQLGPGLGRGNGRKEAAFGGVHSVQNQPEVRASCARSATDGPRAGR